MNIPGITWSGESVDDVEILAELPPGLVRILRVANGFILRKRTPRAWCESDAGVAFSPAIRCWKGPSAFHTLYAGVLTGDIPDVYS